MDQVLTQARQSNAAVIRTPQDMDVFKRAYAVSLEVHRISQTFPAKEQAGLGESLRRSSKTICARLSEAIAKRPIAPDEARHAFVLAIGACSETSLWIDYAFDLGYINEPVYQGWQDAYYAIGQLLYKWRDEI